MRARRALVVLLAAIGLASHPAAAQDAARGRTLYASICAVCHSDPPGSGSVNPLVRTGDEIRAALNRVSPMRYLGDTLTSGDLADIAAYFVTVLGPPDYAPSFDVTGQWANPMQPWWGLFITQYAQRTRLTGGWLTFDEKGSPLWLYFYESGGWSAPGVYIATLFRNTGPPYATPPDAGGEAPRASRVGSIVLVFSASDSAEVTFEVEGSRAAHRIGRVHHRE